MFLIIIILVLLVGAGVFYVQSQNQTPTTPQPQTTQPETNQTQPTTATSPAKGDAMTQEEGEVKEFTIEGGNYSFTPDTITVKKGDTVRITFISNDMVHDFIIDEFDVATKQLPAGEQETIEFVADQAGTFEFYCSVGNHRAMGMAGTLTVK